MILVRRDFFSRSLRRIAAGEVSAAAAPMPPSLRRRSNWGSADDIAPLTFM
jgi:hypothetical protein